MKKKEMIPLTDEESKSSENPGFCDFYNYHKAHLSWKLHWNSSSRSEVMENFSAHISYFPWS